MFSYAHLWIFCIFFDMYTSLLIVIIIIASKTSQINSRYFISIVIWNTIIAGKFSTYEVWQLNNIIDLKNMLNWKLYKNKAGSTECVAACCIDLNRVKHKIFMDVLKYTGWPKDLWRSKIHISIFLSLPVHFFICQVPSALTLT